MFFVFVYVIGPVVLLLCLIFEFVRGIGCVFGSGCLFVYEFVCVCVYVCVCLWCVWFEAMFEICLTGYVCVWVCVRFGVVWCGLVLANFDSSGLVWFG